MALKELFPTSRLLYTADTDKAVSRVIAYRYPGIPNLGDISKINGYSLPVTDILAAGFPCQPFSVVGAKRGTSDERHIFGEIVRIIGEMGTPPRMLVFENVPGLRTAESGQPFYNILVSLASLGYVGRYGLFRASEAGAPHSRARLFIIAFAADSDSFLQRIQDAGENPSPEIVKARQISADRIVSDSETGVWFPFGDAIHRWECITGRTAPFPVSPFPGTAPRGSVRFTEWMMGLPDGWVTDVPGLELEEKVRIVGNGVVPQQALFAICSLASHP